MLQTCVRQRSDSGSARASNPWSPTERTEATSPEVIIPRSHVSTRPGRGRASAIKAANTAPPAPMKRPIYSRSRASQIAILTAPSDWISTAPVIGLGAPTENVSAPPSGWPSAETTRQLKTCVPRRSSPGLTVTVTFSALASAVVASPFGPIKRMISGDTGSLKTRLSVAGGSATVAPSAGSVRTNDACAHAAADCIVAISMTASRSARRRMVSSPPWQKLQSWCGLCASLPVAAGRRRSGRNINPAMDAALALLNHGKVDHLALLQIACDRGHEDELIVKRIGQVAARPCHFGDAFTDLGVPDGMWFRVFAANDIKLPPGLWHRPYRYDAIRNAYPDCRGRRAIAAVQDLQNGLVLRTDRRLLVLQSDMRQGRGLARNHAPCTEKTGTIHRFPPHYSS